MARRSPRSGQSVAGTPYYEDAAAMKRYPTRVGAGAVPVHNSGHTRGVEWCPSEAEAKTYRLRPYSIKSKNYPEQ